MDLLDKPQDGQAPDKPGGSSPTGSPGGSSSSSAEHNASYTIDSDISISDKEYTSTSSAQNALLITGGTVELNNITVNKTGDDSGDDSDFYGYNAAIFATGGSNVKITNSKIDTSGSHANAVFSYSNASIDIDNSVIYTKSNNSGGIMVTGGGSISTNNITVTTEGNSSAAIRSDRGGGTIYTKDGVFTTSGTGSPAIYSTANITTDGSKLISTSSEGVVIEGKNSATLNNTKLEATNNTLNGNSETYKTIFIYQSMSGDASIGTGDFVANDSEIITNKGDHFFVTNTSATITLSNTIFTQNDTSGAFLRAQSGKWGNSGSNGGSVALTAKSQEIIGDIIIDKISSLSMDAIYSYIKTSFQGEGTITLNLSSDSILVLSGDSNISTLNNDQSDNSNIYANGHTLFVNGEEISINQAEAPESFLSQKVNSTTTSTVITSSGNDSGFPTWGIISIIGVFIAIFVVLLFIMLHRNKNKPADKLPEMPPSTPSESNTPDVFSSNPPQAN